MSGAADDALAPHTRGARRAAAGFLVLLLLAVLWPAPAILLNDLTFQAPIAVDEHSFLGREAPSWDVVFWCIAGLYLLAMLHGRAATLTGSWAKLRRDLRRVAREIHDHWREYHWLRFAGASLAAVALVLVVWIFFDAALVGVVEGLQSDVTRTFARLLNRLGGGMNPVMIVVWYLLAGIAYARPRWVELGICMIVAAAAGGILVQVLKYAIGRSRPELWLGPFHHAWPDATSFPSGHTVGAFAIGSVIGFGSKSPWLRVIAFVVAAGVGASRILSFRHWPSDVLASAILGTALGWVCLRPLNEPEAHDRV